MDKDLREFVDIREWEFPVLEDMEDELVRAFATTARVIHLNEEILAGELNRHLFDRIRTLAQTAVNETITYWMQGLGNGHNGKFPELCVEFPYLQDGRDAEPLTVAYFVDNENGTRTELNRISLRKALEQLVQNPVNGDSPADFQQRAKVFCRELRQLARRLEISANLPTGRILQVAALRDHT